MSDVPSPANHWAVHAGTAVDATHWSSHAGAAGALPLVAGHNHPKPPAPRYVSITPAAGPAAGGTPVTIAGDNLDGAGLSITLSLVPMLNVVVVDAGTVTCTTPPGTAGPGDVTIKTLGGTSNGWGAWTYT